MRDVVVRPVVSDDFEALSRLDLTYSTRRYLHIDRQGDGAEVAWRTEWRGREAGERVYAEYPVERLRDAETRADLFLVAEAGGEPCGLLMAVLPSWTDAGEITDLAVDLAARQRGAGRALVESAVGWAHERALRSLWVEPRSDNAAAIEFYLRLGFRISGFNDRMYSNADDAPGETTLFMHLSQLSTDGLRRNG